MDLIHFAYIFSFCIPCMSYLPLKYYCVILANIINYVVLVLRAVVYSSILLFHLLRLGQSLLHPPLYSPQFSSNTRIVKSFACKIAGNL
jgi:hypothetical protein